MEHSPVSVWMKRLAIWRHSHNKFCFSTSRHALSMRRGMLTSCSTTMMSCIIHGSRLASYRALITNCRLVRCVVQLEGMEQSSVFSCAPCGHQVSDSARMLNLSHHINNRGNLACR